MVVGCAIPYEKPAKVGWKLTVQWVSTYSRVAYSVLRTAADPHEQLRKDLDMTDIAGEHIR